VENSSFNFVKYLNAYNGGGVAIGDINNDGLDDIYFSSNQNDNHLYLNKGSLEFENITDKSGTKSATGWTTGVSLVDINADGLLDIYVCKSGSLDNHELRRNELLINKGDLTFENQAKKYGLDAFGYSIQSYFFDYDNDGDLDMYLVNHRSDFVNTSEMWKDIKKNPIVPEFTDRFYRNDGNKFTDVTSQSGITNKAWGLSASVSDFNNDGWMDIYVCNDFILPDHLWINDKKGGFKDSILTKFDHITWNSMGSDVADINNDGMLDLMVLDMASQDHARSKENMPRMNSEQYKGMIKHNYHNPYMFNQLHLNRGNGHFAEIGQLAGVSKTDWSWAPLIQDFDNDGYKDIFVTNGVKIDMSNNDWKKKVDQMVATKTLTMSNIVNNAPGEKIQNYLFRNNQKLQFENKSNDWGFDQKINSSGCAYADLDNDGDMDLVVNNLEDVASVFENKSSNNFCKIKLKGSKENPFGIGATIILESALGKQQYQQFLSRGYQSSVSPQIVMGLGTDEQIKSITVIWPDNKTETITNQPVNKTLTFDYSKAKNEKYQNQITDTSISEVDASKYGLQLLHRDNPYDDFIAEILLPYKLSTQGPMISRGDVNGDGLDDIYIGGAAGYSGSLLIQNSNGKFENGILNAFNGDASYEDIKSLFFDVDKDGDLDLYVVSGGNELRKNPASYQDRLYINVGDGVFKKATNALPPNTNSGSVVCASDFDGDGDLDLFVGGRIVPGKYPVPVSSTLLENKGNKFVDISSTKASGLIDLGLVTDAVFSDYDNDGDKDLMVVGEWMGLNIFINENGTFRKEDLKETTGTGWWYSITAADLDNDGDDDYILGNLGLNNKFGANKEKPFHVFCDDFDESGNLDIVLSKDYNGKLVPLRGKECSSQQMPFISEKFPTFSSFAHADLSDIYGDMEGALHYEANNFESIVLMNTPNGFEAKSLPIEAQFGPTLKTVVKDINGDGTLDILGGGSIYNAEIETVRFDGSKGYVLLGKGNGEFEYVYDKDFIQQGDVKDFVDLKINGKEHLLVMKNSGYSQLFQLQE